jgi:8-oxo-dGTP pyrophosphatase MutT (NUDIX family)
MYKVFINDSSIHFTSKASLSEKKLSKDFLLSPLAAVEDIAQAKQAVAYVFESQNLEEDWQRFLKHFTLVEAAGGVVHNGEGNTLLIHRLSKWDLPKGKMESGETREESAVREVMEECNIPEPHIVKALPTTYHYYALRDVHIIKPTYWFLMEVAGVPRLTPQVEEGITAVVWGDRAKVMEAMEDTYASIQSLMKQVFTS